MQKHKLLDSIRLGDLELRNRVIMAPMTRARAEASSHLATNLMAEYYRQRAGAGLIITEGTWPNDESVGFVNVPGMFTKQQSDSWKKVTNSVHEHGGKIFSQLGHCGPNAHPDLLGGKLPVSASASSAAATSCTTYMPMRGAGTHLSRTIGRSRLKLESANCSSPESTLRLSITSINSDAKQN
jgi:N-ethylmaleimide reductase